MTTNFVRVPGPPLPSEEYRAAVPAALQEGLLTRLASNIAPQLACSPADYHVATAVALRAIHAYCPTNDADALTASRIVSMSLTSVELLSDAARTEMTPAMKLRYIREANALNRVACQTEIMLEKRRNDWIKLDIASEMMAQDLPDCRREQPAGFDAAAIKAPAAAAVQESRAGQQADTAAAAAQPEFSPQGLKPVPSEDPTSADDPVPVTAGDPASATADHPTSATADDPASAASWEAPEDQPPTAEPARQPAPIHAAPTAAATPASGSAAPSGNAIETNTQVIKRQKAAMRMLYQEQLQRAEQHRIAGQQGVHGRRR